MRALLAIGGDAPESLDFLPPGPGFDLLGAADSGLDLLRSWGLRPSLIVGDMDSLSDPGLLALYPEAEIHRLPRAKDESDTEAGLRLLAERGATRIVLAGGGAGRLDHLLALRALFERPLRPVEWYTALEDVYLVEAGSARELRTLPGQTISVFPLGRGARGMGSQGLVWPLEGLVWKPGDFGLSNEAVGNAVRVEAGEGDLLVVRLRGSGRRP